MANNQLISIVDYLRLGSTVHEEHLNTIRDMYKQLSNQMPADTDEGDGPDRKIIAETARRLNIRNDTDQTQDYLCECVRYEDLNITIVIIRGRLTGAVESLNDTILETKPVSNLRAASPPPLQSFPSVEARENETTLDKINCVVNIKMTIPEVHTFIQSFLLQKINKPANFTTTVNDTATETSIPYNKQFILPKECLLDLFIRQQLYERGTIVSVGRQNSTHFRLIEPISMTDDFSTWQYDHWHGLFDLVIEPYDNTGPFPSRWRLADDTHIYCRLSDNDSPVKTSFSSVNDKPRTTSLHVFVRDVCAQENIGQSKAWLSALQLEDILTFEHLANLSQAEWDKIQRLSMHAKKTLKTAVDQERVSVTRKRFRQKHINSDNPENTDDEILQTNIEEESSYSHSEMLANLHLIKLFFWHSLRNDPRIQQYGTLPRLETACLHAAFDEMKEEGFADDGLFPKIKEFFYPLTISEYEIRQKRQMSSNEHRSYLKQHDQLRLDIKRLTNQVNEHAATFWDFEYKCDLLREKLNKAQTDYLCERENIQSKLNNRQQHISAKALQQRDQQWHQAQSTFTGQLKNLNQSQRDASKKRMN